MDNLSLFDAVKFLLIPFLIVYIPVVLGQRYSKYRSRKLSDLHQGPVGVVIVSSFGRTKQYTGRYGDKNH